MLTRRHLLKSTGAASLVLAAPTILRAQTKYTIGFSQPLNNLPWRVAMTNVTKAYADANLPEVELLITDAQNNTTKQLADIESLLGRGIQVLMTSPMDENALAPIINETMAQGVKVITLDRTVNAEVTCHMGAKNEPIGRAAGEHMVKILGGKGNIIEIMGSAGSSAANERSSGFRSAISGSPEMKIVAEQYCDWARAPAIKFMEDMVQRFGPGDIQGVYCHADDEALGALQVLKESGRLNEVKIVSIDGQNEAIQAVADGEIAAVFTYPFCAPDGIIAAEKLARGEELPKDIVLEGKGIFPDNAKEFIGTGF